MAGRRLRHEPGSLPLELDSFVHRLRSAGAWRLGRGGWRPSSLSLSKSARRLFAGTPPRAHERSLVTQPYLGYFAGALRELVFALAALEDAVHHEREASADQ